MSRFDVGWVLGAVIIMAYYKLRPSFPFWPFVMAAIILLMVGRHLAEKYLAK